MKTLAFLPSQERFLPFRVSTLVQRMLHDPRLAADRREPFRRLAEEISLQTHIDFHWRTEDIERLYDAFDPDGDMLPLEPPPEDKLDQRRAALAAAFRKLLLEGNYVELPRRQILECVELQHFGGLRVEANLDDYLDLLVFYRGVRQEHHSTRSWRHAWRKRTRSCTVFTRAAVLVRTSAQPDRVYLKLFKNIVAEDLEMVLPRVRIRMRWVDSLKIGSGVAGSLATAAWKTLIETAISPWLLLIVLGTFLGALVRAFFAYIGSRARYMQALSANLYFQNLANNASVLDCLVEAAEEEETKEMLLAYFFLYVEQARELTTDALAGRAREWLREQFGVEVHFDVHEAVRRLVRRRLATERIVADGPGPAGDADGGGPEPVHRRVYRACDPPSEKPARGAPHFDAAGGSVRSGP